MAFRLTRLLLGLLLAIFFRSVRRVGDGAVPGGGGLLFVANHVNSLLDPLLLLCETPRPPRFLAKAPLFRHPLVAPFLRVLRAIPVYRRQDEGSDPSKNMETFAACVDALSAGEAVALFPEGMSHSEPHLQPLKTGAARIVAQAVAAGIHPAVVPVGLHFSDRSTFRSDAVLRFGSPVDLSGLDFGEGRTGVRELTSRIETALEGVTLNAERFEDLALVEALVPVAREILPRGSGGGDEIALRQAFLAGYYQLREERPEEVALLEGAVRNYRSALLEAGIEDGDVGGWRGTADGLARSLPGVALAALAYPPALYGYLFHFVPYTLTGPSARLVNREPDTLGTYKLYAGMFFYPLFYIAQGWALAQVWGWWWAAAAMAAAIPAGLWSLSYFEFRHRILRRAWAALFCASGGRRSKLQEMRTAVLDALRPLLG